MHILFVHYHHLNNNSGIHIFNLANGLHDLGMTCTVCVPDEKETANSLGPRTFDVVNFDETQQLIESGDVDLIHAWTPRECVRVMTESLVARLKVPYIVHLEDNEEAIVQSSLERSIPDLVALPDAQLDSLIPDHLSHPIRYKQFLKNAAGVTMLIDTLQDFIGEQEAKETIWPGYEDGLKWDRPPDKSLRRQLGIGAYEYVVVYTGNVHPANRQEVFSLYLSVGLLNRRGVPVRLVRTGTDYVPLYDETLNMLDQYSVSLGHVPRTDLPAILSISDALVQPGKADAFNSYRFPSKLPEYLASGKPVLLPKVNIGRFLKDDEEAILLNQGNAMEVAQKLERLLPDQDRRKRIGAGGREFAIKNLRWKDSTRKLERFYRHTLGLVGGGYGGQGSP